MSSNSAVARAAVLAALLAAGVAVGAPARAAEDLSKLQVVPQRSQSADQARRDRYECHNWAIGQTGQAPSAAPTGSESGDDEKAKRAERASRIVTGALLGASLGSFAGAVHDNPAQGALAGAAVGGAVGGATAVAREKKDKEREQAQGPSDYLRALTACLEGRGYTVAMPSVAETVAKR
jgi:hypothetical protein